jgi:hypothetical protein
LPEELPIGMGERWSLKWLISGSGYQSLSYLFFQIYYTDIFSFANMTIILILPLLSLLNLDMEGYRKKKLNFHMMDT